MHSYGIVIHGGAGTISRNDMDASREQAYRSGLQEALDVGHDILRQQGTSLDAVEQAVRCLEENPLFNAGRGSVFTHEGRHEMDAAIMDGQRRAGAVACISGVKHPVTLARAVMDQSNHVLLSGKGAEDFARKINLLFEDETYFFTRHRYEQWQQVVNEDATMLDHSASPKKFGTVGAVALDAHGHLAAATSTGGMTNKRYGRVGDTPLIGCGTYAEDGVCAISCTGHGEFFIRAVVAYDVACLMKYKGMSLEEASRHVIGETLRQDGGEGGLIAIDSAGKISMALNSEGMYRGWKDQSGKGEVLIYA